MLHDSPERAGALLGAPTGPSFPVSAVKPSNTFSSPPAQKDGVLPFRRLKRDSTVLQELEAGIGEAGERSNFSSKLLELGMELRKVKKINDILAAENADLRERIMHQMEAYPDAAEIRALARRYGPELANSVSLLIRENKELRSKLQASIRSQARLQVTATELGNALRDHEEKAYGRELAASSRMREDSGALHELQPTQTSVLPSRGGTGYPTETLAQPPVGGFVRRYCECSKKLQELLDCIDSQINDYERGVWQTRVNVLEEERDSLMLKTVVMRQRLAEIQARIVSDPFLAARFGGVATFLGGSGAGRGRSAMTELQDTIIQLASAQEVNAELERRLASERNISRSWQTNLRALQRERYVYEERAGELRVLDVQLRDHLADLAIAARTSGLRCEVLRGTVAQAGEAAAMKELHGFTRSEKESLMLLRQARDRIASDAQRLEAYSTRVRELEQEVADLRVRHCTSLGQKAPSSTP